MSEFCPNCGGLLFGDGFNTLVHCEFVENIEEYEPDAGPIFCNKSVASVTNALDEESA